MVAPLPASVSIVKKSELIDALQVNNQYARASVSLWGGQVLSFIPKQDGRERLFISEKVLFDGSKSIRAGVPICWPWFGSRQDGFQAHGYVRMRDWRLTSAKDESDYTELVLSPLSTRGAGFDGYAELMLTIQIGKQMRITLSTKNVGGTRFEYNAALHSYFAIENINQTELKGLSGIYSDKVRNWSHFETPSPYLFTEETDRIHLNPIHQVSIQQPSSSTDIESFGHDSLVVWNPWSEAAARMMDMTDIGYQKMLCVETAVTQGKSLDPGQIHSLEQVIN